MPKKGYKQTKEHKGKISQTLTGHFVSIETKQKISESSIGRQFSEETRQKLSKSLTGKKLSNVTKQKLRKATKKQWEEGRVKIHKQSKETKEKLRQKALEQWKDGMPEKVKRKIQESNKGKHSKEKNSNWQGGITPKNKLDRNSNEMKDWKVQVFERDKFTCQKCQQKGGRLIAHHKQGFADYPKLRFDVNNGITFCEKCHEKFHKIYRKWHNTEKQVKEFLGKRRWN